ncbi:30S ribosome-binding factor RbfA [Halothermothrix orenii]|uniref:Ribosome-binding factor A n=1 Tax=Halothermothrix orenii (strain H 168 / OCM 544 / DSM 9562) TaxID=373903 RepID=RBFA_HALOH|nr:30S ribosome-binding factor RbfA [Halothermothrix orenii]B8CW73.1 RecName: Full=Ribosome-binding factor A [Halothermothrix orenii H 168]ACL69542.1 ribosome-binding factor A [Halothermothrix orenii H 168]
MKRQRARRLGELLKKEISDIILREVKDPRIGFISVTDVEVSNDLRHAKVFVSVYGDEKERKETMEGLEKATGYIRKLIGERVKVYYTPEILFRYDDSLEHGARINELLKKVKEEEESDREEG